MCTRNRMDKSVQLHSIRYGKSDANENWMNIQALRSKNTNKRQAKQAIIEDDSNNINKLLYQSMFSRFSCERHQVGMPSAVGIPGCKPFVKQCKFLESSEFVYIWKRLCKFHVFVYLFCIIRLKYTVYAVRYPNMCKWFAGSKKFSQNWTATPASNLTTWKAKAKLMPMPMSKFNQIQTRSQFQVKC